MVAHRIRARLLTVRLPPPHRRHATRSRLQHGDMSKMDMSKMSGMFTPQMLQQVGGPQGFQQMMRKMQNEMGGAGSPF